MSDPENLSPESEKIAESLVLLEFIADLYSDSGLFQRTQSNAPECGSSLTPF